MTRGWCLLLGLMLLPAQIALAQSPQPTALSVQEQNVLKGDELFSEAREAIGRKDYAHAAEKLRALIRLDFPAEPAARELMAGAHVSLAETLLIQKNFAEAEEVAKRGLALTGTDKAPTALRADVYELLGNISSARGDSQKARDYSERARGARSSGAPLR